MVVILATCVRCLLLCMGSKNVFHHKDHNEMAKMAAANYKAPSVET
jgi:hypothetical protein